MIVWLGVRRRVGSAVLALPTSWAWRLGRRLGRRLSGRLGRRLVARWWCVSRPAGGRWGWSRLCRDWFPVHVGVREYQIVASVSHGEWVKTVEVGIGGNDGIVVHCLVESV